MQPVVPITLAPPAPPAPPAPTIHILDRVREAYRATLGVWTGWTWLAAPAPRSNSLLEGPGPLDTPWAWTQWEDACAASLCDHGTDAVEAGRVAAAAREYGEQCQGDAVAAAECARWAVREVECGYLPAAVQYARDARDRGWIYDVEGVYDALYGEIGAAVGPWPVTLPEFSHQS